MSDEIQAEPPKHPLPDGIDVRDIPIRKPRRWVRLWLIATVCFLSGVVTHAVLKLYAPIVHGRAQMADNVCMESGWYAMGLLLFFGGCVCGEAAGIEWSEVSDVLLGSRSCLRAGAGVVTALSVQ